MSRRALPLAALFLLLSASAIAQHPHGAPAGAGAAPPLFDNLGTWSHPVTVSAPLAQKYFDQGLRLYYGFNHEEAIRAFREAARLDPNCAMAWWGVAIAAGPNINMPMDADHAAIANQAIAQAKSLAPGASEPERGYIAALGARYSVDPGASRAGLDSAYANAVRELVRRYPDDPDASALYAESMMDLNPWNQWTHDGAPNPGTPEIVATLEAVLEKNPDHPGANHFYIHAMEASPHPERALAAAGRLETLVPGAGHLVHMPSHILARVTRYADAERVNQTAVSVDEKYIEEQKPEGIYPMMYYNHNVHFIWFAATMEGRSAEAMAQAKKLARNVPPEMARQMAMVEFWPALYYFSLARFGRWDELLVEPPPPADLRYETFAWSYARGLAMAATGDFARARAALDTVKAIAAATPADFMISINPANALQRIAIEALAGEIALHQNRTGEALESLRLAVATEDSLHYDEPPTWPYPARHLLGAALMKAGHAQEAERVYRADLARHPENGWSLFGLTQALRAQRNRREALDIEARFKKAWARADITLSASAF